MKFVDLEAQQNRIIRPIDDRVQKVLSHGQYVSAKECEIGMIVGALFQS